MFMHAPKPTLIVHGGAWAIPAGMAADHQAGVAQALKTGYAILNWGGTATDAVEAAVTILEDDPAFDAGRGSFLTSNGTVQLDALLMDGATLRAGGVACVERLRNPIQAARLVLDKSPHVYFVGAGAEAFAASHGMPLIDNLELVLERERGRLTEARKRLKAGLADITFSCALARDDKGPETAADQGQAGNEPGTHNANSSNTGARNVSLRKSSAGNAGTPNTGAANAGAANTGALAQPAGDLASHDTVGAVALDQYGNIAAGTSTGGTLNKAPGRVGDSSLIGCGCYADNQSAAVSLTGWGEPIMKLVLGKWAVDRVGAGVPPETAAQEAIDYLYKRLAGHGGIILLGPDGRYGLAHNTPHMAWGIADAKGLRTGLTV